MRDDVRTIGFIGLGSQGGPMAHRIHAGGFELCVWARRRETVASFAAAGIAVAASLEAIGATSDVVCLCVRDDADVLEVVEGGLLDGMRPGAVAVIHSTVLPSTCARVAEISRYHDVNVVDAPVSGGGAAATQGCLAVSVGGDDATFRRVEPVLRTFGDPVVHLGALGAGQHAKLLNNLLFCAKNALLHATVDLGTALGLDRVGLAAVLTHEATSGFASRFANGSMTPAAAAHAHRILSKDVAHAVTVLTEAGLDAGATATHAIALLAELSARSV